MRKCEKKERLLYDYHEGIALSIVTCFMFFLYAPLELFFLNQEDFFFDIFMLLPVMLVIFLIVTSICIFAFCILSRWSRKVYVLAAGVVFVIFICSYIQGNFLAKSLPILDGNWIEWDRYPMERVKCIVMWVVVLLTFFGGYKKLVESTFLKVINYISIYIGLMLFVTLLTLGITEGKYEKKVILNTTNKDLFTMSTDENFIVFLLDAVDAKSFSEVIGSDEKYAKIFEDFTAYNNTVGAYPSTRESIPYILTGVWYENQEYFDEYEKKAYAQSPLFNVLKEQGYKAGVYETDLVLDDEGKEQFENVVVCERSVTSYWDFIRWQIQMVGFKYAPYDLKRFCFVNPAAFNTLKVSPNGEEAFSDNNAIFYKKTKQEEIELIEDKCFKFIHLEGGHVPFQYDENVNIINDGTYEDNLKACLTITDAYLEKLKRYDVYDNSVIIIMADHGYDNCIRSNPILYIKSIEEHHDFVVSDIPVSYADLQEIYKKLLQGAKSDELLEYQEGESRDRRWLRDIDGGRIDEYIQSGHATDETTLKPTGVIFEEP